MIDGISFELKEGVDFSFLKSFGNVFCVFDQNDSGNISFGLQNEEGEKFFVKIAGCLTQNGPENRVAVIDTLQKSVPLYQELSHPTLIQLVTSGWSGELFYVVFHWREGSCLFDHWNFGKYQENLDLVAPKEQFKQLPTIKKRQVTQHIFEFMLLVENKGYVAVDFYDGSLMYDFEKDQLTICDIDLFEKGEVKNLLGEDYWGSKRLKAPEEYQVSASITIQTTIFTLGALMFHLLGEYPASVLEEIRQQNRFIPLEKEQTEFSGLEYEVVMKAVAEKPEERYESIQEFYQNWLDCF